ncbi:ATP-binding protein [Achromobacter seleniivolatilans]|uniref:ATP-binding protein n=1 Tax=Achromobacter seleniivolatilans TaxID=3047478 RepID=A0ABY9M006_9BURK|nr:ATP-binding protein [Achromobacter sp. R39]WMD20317.1 ATP-binding protein [Achromobacter sp. R39]
MQETPYTRIADASPGGISDPKPQVFSPHEVVESGTGSYASMASQKGLLLFSCVDVSVAQQVTGYPAYIQQILNQLLGNAIKFTDSGHVIVRLRSLGKTDELERLTLQVVDTGSGIAKEDQTRLFLPARDAHNSTNRAPGADSGLANCARLARLMNSEIRVTSQLGLGSSFSLDLALTPAKGMASEGPDLRGARIYVRSPHRELTNNVCLWLTRWGATATPAGPAMPRGSASDILIDLLSDPYAEPSAWTGRYLSTGGLAAPKASRHEQIHGWDLNSIGLGVQRLMRARARRSPTAASIIPAHYRDLFLSTMESDLATLELAIAERDVIRLRQTLHRMRGALVMVKLNMLSIRFESVENKLKRNSRDEQAFQHAAGLALELRKFLIQISALVKSNHD